MLANISNSFLFILFSMGILLEPVGARSECNSNVLGKNFVLGFPDNYALQNPNIQLHILLVSFNTEMTQVKLTGKFPFSNGSTFGKIVSLHPGEYERVIVPSEYEIIGTEKSLKTIEIESDYKISVYAIHLEAFTTDATYQSTRNGDNTLFAILATTDNTVVTVLLSNEIIYNGTTYSQGDTLTLELKRYEAVQIQSATSSLDNDLTGSIVDSNNPIAVISGHQCANSVGSFCDVILEQSIPVNSWGTKHFYSNPPDDGDFSRFRMIAYFSNTVFTYNGTGITLGPGEVWEDDLYGNGIITTTQPALLVQILIRINGSVVDPSLIQVPSENQFTPFLGFTTPTHAGGNINGFINFVNIIVKTDERPTIRLNNQSIVTANNSLPSLVKETTISDSDYTLLIVELPRMEALYFITQVVDESSPMSAIVYGYERDETYGYAAGLSLPSSERFVTINPFNVRQLGGERLAISLPCESGVIFSDVSSVKCRVGINDEELLEGEFTDLYNVVNCFTLPTFQVGFITLYVSLDAGDNFPFTGLIYIADE
ncbi:hypothetical protein LOD99_2885 [Oopsacas minuta]|uniref:IgGFc-binding protein N-terminal domain-containing protein n=1 Tax=Oopsacas minuta TaxID=111878 RepID=A0AAV7JZC6_9METZ|nr:hypothetical protein LOD99_2885 [Oopsacas minuta]